ncbi:HAD family hydrolase [Microbacterium suwonense]|uniref:Hydrolase n=1 Tax=Microbacterium suwonense TaxID=683047 RepID=A0ABN6X0U7_9MICO|nr:HAD family phosphatase [Microbacterium suwonense]BDZ38335.1 hydrolase [Microbacterium suwonense]
MSSEPLAVLWDMDGTVVDTEPYWMDAETALVESYGGSWTDDDALQLVGNGLVDSARVLQRYGVRMEADAIVQRLTDDVASRLRADGVPFRPGARELLADLRANGVRTALVTMSMKRMALDVVSLIGFTAFDLVLGGDEVPRPKPFPDPYLRAAELLGVDIADAVVIEDSATGVAAGRASGAVTLGVPHILPLDGAGAHELWPSLVGRTTTDIRALHRRLAKEDSR